MSRNWKSIDWRISGLFEPYYSTENYAAWAYSPRFTDYDLALLAEMNINLETK